MAVKSVEQDSDGLWELPEGWAWAALGRLGTWTGGGTPSKANAAFWTNGDVPWVSPKDMKVEVIGETEDKITADAVEDSSAKYVATASVLMVMRSGILRHSFPVAVTDRVVTLNQDLRALTPYEGVSPGYLARYLALAAKRVLDDCSKDGTTVNSIEVSALEKLKVPLAPIAEQRRIVRQVDTLFAEIAEGEAALNRAREGLDTFRRALLKSAVTGELTKDWRENNPVTETGQETGHSLLARIRAERAAKGQAKGRGKRAADVPPLDTSALPALPEGWAYGMLGELSWASSYGTSTKCDATASGAAVLRIPNIRAGAIAYGDMKFATADLGLEPVDYVSPGDLLVIRTNGSETLIGRGGVAFEAPSRPTYFASYLIRFRLLGGELVWNWVSTFFESSTVRSWMTGQIASSAGQYNVSQTSLALLTIPIPPPVEAAEILRRVSDALAAATDTLAMLDAEAADAARLKQSILKAAFEGRLVPQDPANEPAGAMLARLWGTSSTAMPAKRGRRTKSSL